MGGIGVFELVFVVLLGLVSLLPTVAAGVFLWMLIQGRFRAPKTCPKCGADLRG
jgi:hypothetical protein